MIDRIKSIFHKDKKVEQQDKYISIKEGAESLIQVIIEAARQVYKSEHMFMRKYLLPIINVNNISLIKDLEKYIRSINQKKYDRLKLSFMLEQQITSQQGYISLILSVWYPYIATEINNQYDTTKFFRVEVFHVTKLITDILELLYQSQEEKRNNQVGILSSRLFKIRLIDAITDHYEFEKVKTSFVKKFKFGCGVNGEFSPSQIQMTTNQLDRLIMFKQIPTPFHQSIGIAIDFYKEYRLKEKVRLLVAIVQKAKQQIVQYREFFHLGNTVLGSDQIMPVINYICEKSTKNIYASAQYIRALLGGGEVYNDEMCRMSIKDIEKKADYCLDLIESMSSICCHASRMNI